MGLFQTTTTKTRSVVRPTTAAAGLVAMALAMTAASSAVAEGNAARADVRPDLSRSIDVKLTGHIPAHCLISGGRDIDLGELRGGVGFQARFGLDCNIPFSIDVHSLKGGLAHATMPQGQGPFAGLLEYDLKLSIDTVRPEPGVIQALYSSRELLGERTLSSGDAIGNGGGTLEFRTREPEGAGLLAGRYSETLTLVVTPIM